ncbi:acyltransferase family protein [Occallatibacter riparius]|uniref:Acyltransferase n=1 Tax=Occallatibacter riparius TaxID=1002689 RepID=A0A9J7BU26_9BACT|nr:acyltransferase family protein [Occallatibacter riparius]UWZ86143.1 acyltransferase [Occallatibacter riparius]
MFESRGSADSHRTQYRPHIDGLRAVAVLSVIFFHFSDTWFPGGYLGVDIFFVISGYLITKVIWREANDNEFTLARFYERRVRRIMPALLFLLLFVSVVSFLLLLPLDLKGYAKSLFASVSFAANLYFWRTTGYFGGLASEKPLLHLWSLGVEEQFYILFPMLVVLCTRWRRSILVPVTAGLVVLSFAANTLALRIDADKPAFYLLPTRAWEIGAGCLLALMPVMKLQSKWIREFLAIVAVGFLVWGLFFNGGHLWTDRIPVAIWVVLGATLAIYLGESGGCWSSRLLSLPLMTFIGLISYSLYLWHWPLLVFTRYYLIESTVPFRQVAILLVVMFGLATLSWRYIERPFRSRSMPVRRVVAWVASGSIVVIAAAGVVLKSDGFPSRYNQSIAKISAEIGTEYRCEFGQYFLFGGGRACLLGASGKDPDTASVALMGNSHVEMYAPLVTEILRKEHKVGIMVPLTPCLPMPDFNLSQACSTAAAKNLRAVESLSRVQTVIIGMTWDRSAEPPFLEVADPDLQARHFRESLDRVIDGLEKSGKSVILVGPIATPRYQVASVVARQLAFAHKLTAPLYWPADDFINRYQKVFTHYSSKKDIVFIRPDEIQCQNGKCDFFRDGMPLFADDNHVTQDALPLFRPAFEPVLTQIFEESRSQAVGQ